MSDKSKPLPPKSRQQRLLDIINAPPSREMVEMLNPKSPASIKATADAMAILNTPPSQETLDLLKGKDEEFEKFKALLLPKTNTRDSLSPGEEFAEPTPEEILARPALTEMQILLAPPSAETLAALKVGILGNKDGSDQIYLTGKSLDAYLLKGGVPGITSFKMAPFDQAQKDIASKYLGMITETAPGALNPGLVKRMATDPEVAMYANYAVQAGNAAGINGTMYANQLWAESRFNPDAVSGKGAMGIAQMMPFHQGKYGLNSRDDFFDPFKSIDAGVTMMSEMTNKFKDQRLAIVAYNGGEGAIDFVEKKLGKNQISYSDWEGFMQNRRSQNPSNNPSAWQNETFKYVKDIAGSAQEKPAERPKASPPELTIR
jgi:hypothetical protein